MKVGGISNTSGFQGVQITQRNIADQKDNSVIQKQQANDKNYLTKGNTSSQSKSIGEQELLKAIERANKAIEGTSRRFEYSVHEKTNSIMVKVINTENDEVIREIPPEKILDLVAKLWEMAGIIVDKRI